MRHAITLLALLATLAAPASSNAAGPTLLLRQPTVSADHVAFAYAGDIWLAGRDGSDPRRLTVHAGLERDPHLSPDGQRVAFTAEYDGNVDVYVVDVDGGQPVRLTYHPYPDSARGWTPDGDGVFFRSTRLGTHHHRSGRLFTVPVDGGWPEPLPMPHAERGSLSTDGTRVAYTPFREAFSTWKRYRGGRTTPV
ncbi:MAG: protease, partial [Myxococcota bacterium]|nr:protease [Myxococcota bacterium]